LFKWLWKDQLLLLGGKWEGAGAKKVARLAENFRSELENVVSTASMCYQLSARMTLAYCHLG
jgi:hypothetical protein